MDTLTHLLFVIIFLVVLFNGILGSITYTSHQNLIECTTPQNVQYPNSIPEVASLVKTAVSSNKKIKAIGTLHSITDIICTDGLPVSITRINHAIYNPFEESATFGAGIGLSDALTFLEGKGRSLIHTPAWGLITLGGALATGAHGSSLLHPTTISDQVIRLTVVDGKGSLVNVVDSQYLDPFKGHLGMLGILVEVTLRTVPLFKMRLTHTILPEKVLSSGEALRWSREVDFFQFFWFPLVEEVVLINGTYLSNKAEGNAKSNLVIGPMMGYGLKAINTVLDITGNQALSKFTQNALKRHIAGQSVGLDPLIVENGVGVNPGIGTAWRLLRYECQPGSCIWDYDSFHDISMTFDLNDFDQVLALVQTTTKHSPEIFHMGLVYIRFIRASSALTSTTGGRDSFVLEWVLSTKIIQGMSDWAKEKVAKYDEMLREMVDKFGGRPHWGKKGLCYFRPTNFPKLTQFVEATKKWDPTGVFQNDFSTRLLNMLDTHDVEPMGPFCSFEPRNNI